MHFLGLAGMPRRISDYPDMYTSLNQLCSIGSYISMLGMVLFFVLIYQLLAGKEVNVMPGLSNYTVKVYVKFLHSSLYFYSKVIIYIKRVIG